MPDQPEPAALPELPTLAPGMILAGRFRLESIAGQGGMSVVWKATDLVLSHETALKFLPTVLSSDPMALEDLRREARRARDLAHPYICRVYDYGEDSVRRLAWISMEYLPGGSLAHKLRDHPRGFLEPDEILPWVKQLAEALSYAHDVVRVVHRDLKPVNLLLDSHGAVRITDFGIAQTVSESITRLTGALSPAATSRTGTVYYMSPQQARGERARPTDDLYSLGATMFELLTGQPPFTTGDLNWQREHVPAPRVADRRWETVHVEAPIPEHWERIIQRLLAKHPSHRPQTAREVIAALEAPPAPKGKPAPSESSIPANPPSTKKTTAAVAPAPKTSTTPVAAVIPTERSPAPPVLPPPPAPPQAKHNPWTIAFIVLGVLATILLGCLAALLS